MPTRIVTPFSAIFLLITFFATLSYSAASQAAGYTLAIQPILPQKELKKRFQPLADYLSQEIGQTITITT